MFAFVSQLKLPTWEFERRGNPRRRRRRREWWPTTEGGKHQDNIFGLCVYTFWIVWIRFIYRHTHTHNVDNKFHIMKMYAKRYMAVQISICHLITMEK